MACLCFVYAKWADVLQASAAGTYGFCGVAAHVRDAMPRTCAVTMTMHGDESNGYELPHGARIVFMPENVVSVRFSFSSEIFVFFCCGHCYEFHSVLIAHSLMSSANGL